MRIQKKVLYLLAVATSSLFLLHSVIPTQTLTPYDPTEPPPQVIVSSQPAESAQPQPSQALPPGIIIDSSTIAGKENIVLSTDQILERSIRRAHLDFPQLKGAKSLENVATRRFTLPHVVFNENEPTESHVRYPNGPPGLEQVYSVGDVERLYIPIFGWETAPSERDVWGRSKNTDDIPPITDYVLVHCDKPLKIASLVALLGRTRLSVVLSEARTCLQNFLRDTADHMLDLPKAPPETDRERLVGGLHAGSNCNSSAVLGDQGKMVRFLKLHAPSWSLSQFDNTTLAARRRLRAFHFAVTGGSDRRAAFVEHTWGQRTPLQWYGDTWLPSLRPITAASKHPRYVQDRFQFLTFKMSRIWELVYRDFYCRPSVGDDRERFPFTPVGADCGASAYKNAMGPRRVHVAERAYDWYIRLWDDNWYQEHSLYNILGRLRPEEKIMPGKIGWRNMGRDAVFPFAGGGAGWFLSKAGLAVVGPSFSRGGEEWFVRFRARKDIFMMHGLHNEDVFLTAWFAVQNITMWNIPGVEHVSPGMLPRQRCMTDWALHRLTWAAAVAGDCPRASLHYDYPVSDKRFLLEETPFSFSPPLVWHYMSPSRLLQLEKTLHGELAERIAAERNLNVPVRHLWADPLVRTPRTASDKAPSAAKQRKKTCYPGVPLVNGQYAAPDAGQSIFENLLPELPGIS